MLARMFALSFVQNYPCTDLCFFIFFFVAFPVIVLEQKQSSKLGAGGTAASLLRVPWPKDRDCTSPSQPPFRPKKSLLARSCEREEQGSATMAHGTVVRYSIGSQGVTGSSSESVTPVAERSVGAENDLGDKSERFAVVTMMLVLLIIGCTLFGMLFWLLSEDLAMVPTLMRKHTYFLSIIILLDIRDK
ncbi:hypothetical protein MTO96_025565 [Rhipicephalus appendiculatus]